MQQEVFWGLLEAGRSSTSKAIWERPEAAPTKNPAVLIELQHQGLPGCRMVSKPPGQQQPKLACSNSPTSDPISSLTDVIRSTR